MKTAYIIDSTFSARDEIIDRPDVFQVNLRVNFPNGDYIIESNDEQATIDFYQKMETFEELPKTSQPEPQQFIDVYEKIVDQGFERVFSLHLPDALSGTSQTNRLVAQDYQDQLETHFIDAKSVSYVGENILEQLLELGATDKDGQEIAQSIQQIADETVTYVMISELDHTVKGGRLSKGSSMVGKLLNIKPILTINQKGNGEVEVYEKVRSVKRVYRRYLEYAEQAYDKYDGKINFVFAHSNAEPELQKLIALFKEKFDFPDYRYGILTPILGTHGGSGAIGMGYIPQL